MAGHPPTCWLTSGAGPADGGEWCSSHAVYAASLAGGRAQWGHSAWLVPAAGSQQGCQPVGAGSALGLQQQIGLRQRCLWWPR